LIRLSKILRLVALLGEFESSCGSSEVMTAAIPIDRVVSSCAMAGTAEVAKSKIAEPVKARRVSE
jgi:hypothetical protein